MRNNFRDADENGDGIDDYQSSIEGAVVAISEYGFLGAFSVGAGQALQDLNELIAIQEEIKTLVPPMTGTKDEEIGGLNGELYDDLDDIDFDNDPKLNELKEEFLNKDADGNLTFKDPNVKPIRCGGMTIDQCTLTLTRTRQASIVAERASEDIKNLSASIERAQNAGLAGQDLENNLTTQEQKVLSGLKRAYGEGIVNKDALDMISTRLDQIALGLSKNYLYSNALVPPPKCGANKRAVACYDTETKQVFVTPNFFDVNQSPADQISTLIHEEAHRFGNGSHTEFEDQTNDPQTTSGSAYINASREEYARRYTPKEALELSLNDPGFLDCALLQRGCGEAQPQQGDSEIIVITAPNRTPILQDTPPETPVIEPPKFDINPTRE